MLCVCVCVCVFVLCVCVYVLCFFFCMCACILFCRSKLVIGCVYGVFTCPRIWGVCLSWQCPPYFSKVLITCPLILKKLRKMTILITSAYFFALLSLSHVSNRVNRLPNDASRPSSRISQLGSRISQPSSRISFGCPCFQSCQSLA